MKELQKRLADRKITVTLTDAAKDYLAKTGFDPNFGARPLKRTIQREVEYPLSKKILQGEFKEGEEVKVDLSTEGLVFSTDGR
jgi:ATP-dependent Clp protease ATP-binding subunit ClpB